MEENKNFNPQQENDSENISETVENLTENNENTSNLENTNNDTEGSTETTENPDAQNKQKKGKKTFKNADKKPKKTKLRNQAFLKKGTYSVAITTIVLAGIIVFNILVSALSDRFVLEFDMTAEKENSISEENIDFIKDIDKEVEVIVCAAEDSYSTIMGSVAEQSYNVVYDGAAAEYYDQTIKLINKYHAYNKKIKVKYVDTQTSEFSAVASKYSDYNIAYGDIIVSSKRDDGTERHKKIGYEDIYALLQDQTYASMGIKLSKVDGNDIETALTSAIAYAISDIESKVALLTGHASADYTRSYKALLEKNNYAVTVIPDTYITNIPGDYDIVVIAGASKDFLESEISVLSEFLDNDNHLGKGMIVFADANAPYLPNLYGFLSEWGVSIKDGILFETDQSNYLPDSPTTLGSYSSGADSSFDNMRLCISGNNVPMQVSFEKRDYMRVAAIIETPETTVAAPKGVPSNWTGAGSYQKAKYATVIEAIKSSYNDDNEEIESRVAVFSSIHFLESEYNESATLSNKNVTLAMIERASGVHNTGISFITKSITSENYANSVTQASADLIKAIFMFALPILVILTGTIIYFKRRNA